MKYIIVYFIFPVTIFLYLSAMNEQDTKICKKMFQRFQKAIERIYTSKVVIPESPLSADLEEANRNIQNENPQDFCAQFSRLQDVENHLESAKFFYSLYSSYGFEYPK